MNVYVHVYITTHMYIYIYSYIYTSIWTTVARIAYFAWNLQKQFRNIGIEWWHEGVIEGAPRSRDSRFVIDELKLKWADGKQPIRSQHSLCVITALGDINKLDKHITILFRKLVLCKALLAQGDLCFPFIGVEANREGSQKSGNIVPRLIFGWIASLNHEGKGDVASFVLGSVFVCLAHIYIGSTGKLWISIFV